MGALFLRAAVTRWRDSSDQESCLDRNAFRFARRAMAPLVSLGSDWADSSFASLALAASQLPKTRVIIGVDRTALRFGGWLLLRDCIAEFGKLCARHV